MDRSDVCTLLAAERTQDAYGVWVETITERDVFCSVNSVTRAEFFEGGRNGLNPEYRITMFYADYNGETMLRYKDKTYTIYRTFLGRNDTLELYVERQGGSNGKRAEDGEESGSP